MLAQINLREVAAADRFKPDAFYTWRKAQSAVNQSPRVYRIEGDVLVVDTAQAPLSIQQIKDKLQWGVQWNSWEV